MKRFSVTDNADDPVESAGQMMAHYFSKLKCTDGTERSQFRETIAQDLSTKPKKSPIKEEKIINKL